MYFLQKGMIAVIPLNVRIYNAFFLARALIKAVHFI